MKTRKFVSKMIVLLLVYFHSTAGAARPLNTFKCDGECCQNKQNKSHHKRFAHRLSAHSSIEFGFFTLLCDPIQQLKGSALKTPKQENCHNGTVRSCCRLAKANGKMEGLISTALFRADRPLGIGPVSILSEIDATKNSFNTASVRYSLPARATPAPLYLRNSVLLC